MTIALLLTLFVVNYLYWDRRFRRLEGRTVELLTLITQRRTEDIEHHKHHRPATGRAVVANTQPRTITDDNSGVISPTMRNELSFD